MDPIAAAAGSALVSVIATDAWQQARDAVVSLWRRVHPQQAYGIRTELDTLRGEVLQAREDGDSATESAFERAWQVKLAQLLRAEPALVDEMRQVLDQILAPTLSEQTRIGNIRAGTAGVVTVNRVGRDVNVVRGNQYTAGRDQTIHRP